MTREAAIKLAKKLHALAEQGYGGEATNASAMLVDFLKKHNIKIDDVTGVEEPIRRMIRVHRDAERIAIQIIAMILTKRIPRKELSIRGHRSDTNTHVHKRLFFTGTEAEFVEIQMLVDVYTEHFFQEMKFFRDAYIQKNRLFAQKMDDEEEPIEELSMEDMWKLQNYMSGIDRKIVRKQLK